jgi:hypothetical protein
MTRTCNNRLIEKGTRTSRKDEDKKMRKLKLSSSCTMAILMALLAAGCGDADKISLGNPQFTAPMVTSVTPPDVSPGVCPNSALITATFSKAMNPNTIDAATFTLTSSAGSVTGSVMYNPTTNVATFTPSPADLLVGTTYTATITTGAADTFGNRLAANFVWTFTTAAAPCAAPSAIALGTACGFGILAATPAVANVPTTTPPGPTHVTGNIGIFPAASITGFPPGTFTGSEELGTAAAGTAQNDALTAYNNALNAGGGPSVGTAIVADIGEQTLPPGIYKATTALGITGILTLDGSTNPNGVWIFKVGSALTTAAGALATPASQVILIGGAQPNNVFWQIGSSATLGTYSLFQGTILAQASITLTTGATLDGRALALTGQIALDNNPVNVTCP